MGTTIFLLMTLCLGIVSVSCEELLDRHKRNWIIESFKIEEGANRYYPYVLGNIRLEKNIAVGYHLSGQGVDQEPVGKLSINSNNGEVSVNGELDYEMYHFLRLIFEAKDKSTDTVITRLAAEVEVLDINDNPPDFEKDEQMFNLKESASQADFLTAVTATDKDKKGTNNSTFDLKIVSVTPKPPDDLTFFLRQHDTSGSIGFKGCLDYEKSEKYTILVEAKDRGEVVQLSSTCTVIINIEDENNHLPVFTGQTGAGSVKERDSGVEVLRLQVSDQDSKGSNAWMAKYTIQGDKDQNFKITTDPNTNEGVLSVEKPLDYEDGSLRNLSISVENEALFFSCKVKSRTDNDIWKVETMKGTPAQLSTYKVSIKVEDVNDPPVFTPVIKDVMVEENIAVGLYLETMTAKDMDWGNINTFVYVKKNDSAGWVAVDTKSGKVTTAKILDRESPHVKNNVYQVTVLAVDDGKPPMTGTGTLNIHIKDQNDNIPQLNTSTMDMCLSEKPSMANITAFDLDGDPYSGPFTFQLQGDNVKGKWRIDPKYGYTVNLVKENTVYAGHHELLLEVLDQQGRGAIHNLSITVCDCSGMTNCRMRRASGAKIGASAVLIFMTTFLLLLGILLLAFLMTCKRELKLIPTDQIGEEHLIKSNIEIPGTDCKVPTQFQMDSPVETKATFQPIKTMSTLQKSASMRASACSGYVQNNGQFQRGTTLRKSAPTKLHSNGFAKGSMSRSMTRKTRNSSWREEQDLKNTNQLMALISQGMNRMQVPGEELGDYAPHPYVEEGDLETDHQLDAISIPETHFTQDTLLYLGPRFNNLASICNTQALNTS
ncbi:hypothetical protein UPYG_G00013740 [Umbra pygmaea]|uniref:Cadherin domain-containing protein n=1 Tax=Umbra pygmaea TaxID=75934 RepID=A0ABD0Y3C2_UMBPY